MLGVFTQLFPQVLSETFLFALLTAILLEFVLLAKKKVVGRLRSAPTPAGRVVSAAGLVLVMAGSKFVVLELTALLFGDAVRLGGFFQVTALIICLMLSRAGVRRLVAEPEPAEPVTSGA